MFLKIKDTGTPTNPELQAFIETNFGGIGFDEIYIAYTDELKYKTVDITYPNVDTLRNTICMGYEELNQNILNWLNTL